MLIFSQSIAVYSIPDFNVPTLKSLAFFSKKTAFLFYGSIFLPPPFSSESRGAKKQEKLVAAPKSSAHLPRLYLAVGETSTLESPPRWAAARRRHAPRWVEAPRRAAPPPLLCLRPTFAEVAEEGYYAAARRLDRCRRSRPYPRPHLGHAAVYEMQAK